MKFLPTLSLSLLLVGSSAATLTAAAFQVASPGQSGQASSAGQKETPPAPASQGAKGNAEASPIDPRFPAYTTARAVSGEIKTVGSDTMNVLFTLWGEDFRSLYPNVKVEIDGKGSATAPPALIKGTSTFGPMSRPMKSEEIDEFQKAFGYPPTGLMVGLDMLVVFVHKDNPLAGLSLSQVDAIFSKTRRGGAREDITTWGQLGLTGEWADKPIAMYGRNSASGTYGYFQEHALSKGDFKESVKEQAGSAAVVSSIAGDKYAIGYSGIGYMTAGVRALPLSARVESSPITAIPENAYNGTYPLCRGLLVYLNHKPGAELDPLRSEFLRFVYSHQGQAALLEDGYLPITFPVAKRQMGLVGLTLEPAPAVGTEPASAPAR
jgi:phosphate transport system substrate-binding protein